MPKIADLPPFEGDLTGSELLIIEDGEGTKRVPSSTVSGSYVPRLITTSGNLLNVARVLYGEPADDGTAYIIRGGRRVGWTIPAGAMGSATYVVLLLPFDHGLAAALKDGRIGLRTRAKVTPGYKDAVSWGGNYVRVERKDGAIDDNEGETLGPVLEQDGILTRDFSYVVAGDERWIGATMQVGSTHAPVAQDMSFEIVSAAWEVIDVPDADGATTSADAVLRARLAQMAPAVDIMHALKPVQGPNYLKNGAGYVLDAAGKIVGVEMPAGASGEGSVLQWALPLDGRLRAMMQGNQQRISLGFDVPENWARSHVLNMQVGRLDLTTLDINRFDFVDDQGSVGRLEISFSFICPDDFVVAELRPYLVFDDPAIADQAERFVLTDATMAIYRNASDITQEAAATDMLGAELARSSAVAQAAAVLSGTGRRVGALLRAASLGTLALALQAATALASPGAMAAVTVPAGIFAEHSLGLIGSGTDGDHVILQGAGIDRTIIDGRQGPDTHPTLIRARSPLDFNASQQVGDLSIWAANCRYGWHIDPVNFKPNSRLEATNVSVTHFGNDAANAYWGSTTWGSPHGIALGTCSGSHYLFTNVRAVGPRAGFSAHNQVNFDHPSIITARNCDFAATWEGYWALRLESVGSRLMDRYVLEGSSLSGEISMTVSPWYPTAIEDQPADRREWDLRGSGNTPAAFRSDSWSRALRIVSSTMAVGSRVEVSGTAADAISTRPFIETAGDVGLSGSARSWGCVQETIGVGPNRNILITALGKRLGDCTATPKQMTVTLDRGLASETTIVITFDQDYRGWTNWQVLQVINAALDGHAVAAEYDVEGRYRPFFADEEQQLQNRSGSTILMGMALAHDTRGALSVRPMTAADQPSAFAGIAWEDIRPNAYGRVKTAGWLPTTDLLRSDGASPELNTTFTIDPERPGYVRSNAGAGVGILRVVRPSLGNGLWTVAVDTAANQARAALETENIDRRRVAARDYATPRVTPAHMMDGKLILAEDANGAFFYLDPVTGKVSLHNLQLDGGAGLVANGRIPLMRAQGGQPMLSFDLFDRRIVADYGEMLGAPPTSDFDFLRVTEWDEAGQPLAGYEPGQRIRLHPQVLDGLSIQGDHNKVPQLWALVDSPKGPTRMKRQLTFSQYGVTGFQVIQRPDGTKPGFVRISCNDTDPIRDRHKVRHAHWHVSEPATAAPQKIVYIVVIGQSNSVAAGSYGYNPTGITGPQTIRTAMPIRKAAFASRLLTWNGGTIPHQGILDGDAIVGGVEASTIPIDAARIASFVPMREGLGQDGADVKGGWTRESFVTALATHLNGPNGYDGSVYLAAASFGFGSRSFAQLIHDGTNRMQPWHNALASIDTAKAIANAKGVALEVHLLIDQGEADWSNANYRAQVEAAWAIMKGDITSRTAQAAAPQLFYHQTIQARGPYAEPAYSGLAQVELARNNADIHILPPHYFTDFDGDTIHYKAPEETWRGALSGEAMADWLIRGETAALMMQSATWGGSKMTVTMNHPVTRDAETISLTSGNGGLSHSNSAGTTVTLSTALIDETNPTRIVGSMSAAIPAGAVETARMGYGNQAMASALTQGFDGGQRTVFKRADWRRYSLIDGRPLDIFATIQTLAATQEA
ncbi:hypothetical protein [Sphingobium abikonense]|uniref:hypothetical protein n=1 Tax=Sphingobium abikonense TaxID=86193 RepID=UPI000788956B|nr:hypothetical protein [Sphingobium abikonense]